MIMPAGMTILTRAAGPNRIGRVMSDHGCADVARSDPRSDPRRLARGRGVSWRWIFFINVPIGIVALALALRVLPRDVAGTAGRSSISSTSACCSPGLALMIYGLAESSSAGGFGSPRC